MAEMTPDFSPFSYGLNNTVNVIDEWGLMGSGWNTRGRQETEAETANKEAMDEPKVKNVSMTQSPGAMANIPDFGSKGWYKKANAYLDKSGITDNLIAINEWNPVANIVNGFHGMFTGSDINGKKMPGITPVMTMLSAAPIARPVKAVAPLAKKLPTQIHHFATNKNSTFTKLFTKITDKYKLDLNGTWNKMKLPHQGRHPNKYHQFVLKHMEDAQNYAGKSTKKFLQYFNENVVKPVQDFPELLRKSGWND